MKAGSPHTTVCGLPGIGTIPYGLHACHVYSDRAGLLKALVPYFIAGLEARERCFWITAWPVSAREAIEELRGHWPGATQAVDDGSLVIVDGTRWYASASGVDGADVVPLWLREEERALADGYRGLRVSGNVSFLTPEDWGAFMNYEHEVTARLRGRRIVALCSYAADQCALPHGDEVIHAHHCAFESVDSAWQVVSPVLMPRRI